MVLAGIGSANGVDFKSTATLPTVSTALPASETTTPTAPDQLSLTATSTGTIPAVRPLLPPITREQSGRLTFTRNAHGQLITLLQKDNGSRTYTHSSERGLSFILNVKPDQTPDTLVFSHMGDGIKRNSLIPNQYFHLTGAHAPEMTFDSDHNMLITLKNGEAVVVDGRDGETILNGPFQVTFNPSSDGHDFAVDYHGSQSLKKQVSRGDRIKW